jgi:hypothetical protein
MNCRDIQNELVAFVLNELNLDDQANIERHLASGCSECNLQLTSIRESVELLWQAVPNRRLADDFQRDILARAVAVELPAETTKIATVNLDNADRKVWLLSKLPLQSLVAFAAGLLFSFVFNSMAGDRANETAVDTNGNRASEVVSLASPQIPSNLEMTERQHESAHLVSLRNRAGSRELRGFVLWDSLASEIHVYCFGLKQPQMGTQYSLWLIGPSVEIRAAERLDIDANGNCKAVVQWPVGEFRFARVTVEPSSSMNNRPSENVELTSNVLPVFPR